MQAIEAGFKSIEVDVFSNGDSLYVAHDREDIKPGRTIRNLYLNPLKEITEKNQGFVYKGEEQLILLVDIKDDGLRTYKLLELILENYSEMISSYNSGTIHPNAIMVIVSGNRPRDYMKEQKVRLAFYDGRISELGAGIPHTLMALVSDNWNRHFKWRGQGEMPADEKEKLSKLVEKAHDQDYLLRFWATPERPEEAKIKVWKALSLANVDLIGTDDISGLLQFLSAWN